MKKLLSKRVLAVLLACVFALSIMSTGINTYTGRLVSADEETVVTPSDPDVNDDEDVKVVTPSDKDEDVVTPSDKTEDVVTPSDQNDVNYDDEIAPLSDEEDDDLANVSIGGGLLSYYETADEAAIYYEVVNLPSRSMTVRVELYSGDTYLTYKQITITPGNELGCSFYTRGSSSSWEQGDWTAYSVLVPDKAVLYIDGEQIAVCNDGPTASEWAAWYDVVNVCCKIGDTYYETLTDAVAAVPADGTQTTITLLADTLGNGVVVKAGQNIVFDLGGYTYTIDGTVGSTGTAYNGLQLLKDSTVTITNGTLAAGANSKHLIQNYSDLTLKDVTLDGTTNDICKYVLSNCYGDVVITGNTKILAKEGMIAFDVYYWNVSSYADGLSVTLDSNFTGTIQGDIEYASSESGNDWVDKAALVIENGTINGGIVTTVEDANIEISGGYFEDAIAEEWCAEGLAPTVISNGKYTVAAAVARIDDVYYASLADAVAAVPTDGTQTTITLLADTTGDGVVVKAGQNVVFDFDGYTYTVDGTVGSAGTVTLGFQLLKGSTVTLKDGTLVAGGEKVKILVQNYCDLTLDNMDLDGTQNNGVCSYVLSNNCGNVVITGDSDITAADGKCAFDLWYGMSSVYDSGITITFDSNYTGTVTGNVEYGAANRVTDENWTDNAALVIKNGNFDITIVTDDDANISISGGSFSKEVNEDYCADGFVPCADTDGTYDYTVGAEENVYIERELTVSGVTVSGSQIHKDAVLVVDSVETADGEKLNGYLADDQVMILTAEVHFELDGEYVPFKGDLEITFTVDSKYNGEAATVWHIVDADTTDTLSYTIADNSVVVTVDSLSPFGIAVVETVDDNNDSSSDSSSSGGDVLGEDDVKTGDDFNAALWVSILLVSALGIAAAVYFELKARKNREF